MGVVKATTLYYFYVKSRLFHLLSQLVKTFFSVVGTSVPSERLFSSAGNLITDKRDHLSPENVEKLLFLYENIG